MGLTVEGYPKQYHDNLRAVMSKIPTDVQTAYAMILMTSMLMDLDPTDSEVAEIVIEDCAKAMGCDAS